jgi:hypothetical protein
VAHADYPPRRPKSFDLFGSYVLLFDPNGTNTQPITV